MTALAVLFLVVVGVGFLRRGSPVDAEAGNPSSPGQLAVSSEAATTAAQEAGVGSWRPVASAPIGARWGAAGAWTDRELVVWGGRSETRPREPSRTDGAAYDPATDRWRTLSPAPLSAGEEAVAVWTGDEVIVVAGIPPQERAAAAYDPDLDRWRPLPPIPLPPRSGSATVWTGQELVVWGGTAMPGANTGTSPWAGARYDPLTDAWRLTAPSPVTGVLGQGVWTGRELVVYNRLSGLAYEPATDTWRRLPDTPHLLRASGRSLAWTDEQLLVAGDYPEVGAYGLSLDLAVGAWSTIPLHTPLRREVPFVTAVPIDGRVALLHAYRDGLGGEGLLWSATGGWERMAPSPVLARSGSTVVWTGQQLLVWGGVDAIGVAADGAVWR